ncbi:uncharacterized protein LOC143766999 [Ranitomeya variabilis]|uniref:uncharacterized protein LOC143766999 n=1 Tax=Ranitomeya variabilis TaxID=490064 RepID=UPI004056A164
MGNKQTKTVLGQVEAADIIQERCGKIVRRQIRRVRGKLGISEALMFSTEWERLSKERGGIIKDNGWEEIIHCMIEVSLGPKCFASRFLYARGAPTCLLGTDVLKKLEANIKFRDDGTVMLTIPDDAESLEQYVRIQAFEDYTEEKEYTTDLDLSTVPETLWAQGDTDVGLLHISPVKLSVQPGAVLPQLRQYPVSAQQELAITKQIEGYREKGVLVEIQSPANTPLYPVKKRTLDKSSMPKYRMVHDLREINKVLDPITPVVPNPHTLLSQIPASSQVFTVIDLSNAFFSVPLHQDSWHLFAFTFKGKQLAWTRLPQGMIHSPTLYSNALQTVLQRFEPEPQVVILQYVDDLLLCCPDLETAERSTVSLLCFLEKEGCKVNRQKLQVCQIKVVFLGHCISQGKKHLTPQRTEAIRQMNEPRNHKQLRAFLGIVSHCRQWIIHASQLMQPLYDCVKSEPYLLTKEGQISFQQLKDALVSAPALGLPDYTKPFQLMAAEVDSHATGVLTQKHAGKQRPIAYLSARLDPVARAVPTCVRVVVAVSLLLDKASEIVLEHPLTVQTTHDVYGILNQVQPKHISMARHLRLQCSLLLPSTITFARLQTLNLATLLPLESEGGNKDTDPHANFFPTDTHDCTELILQETVGLPNVSETPLQNPDLELFIDGSRFADDTGNFHTGYAVVSESETLKAEPLPPKQSAQEAELTALIEALKIAENQTANIYTDSRYAHGIVFDFGVIWRARGYMTASGQPVKHASLIKQILEAAQETKEVAVIKVAAHVRLDTRESRGNDRADKAAKAAAVKPLQQVHTVNPTENTEDRLRQAQEDAGEEERDRWKKEGAEEQAGIWKKDGLICLPRAWYPIVVGGLHHPTHVSANAMTLLAKQVWLAPGFGNYARDYCAACVICLAHNPGQTTKTPMKHHVRPLYPFQRLQIDFIQLPKSNGRGKVQ